LGGEEGKLSEVAPSSDRFEGEARKAVINKNLFVMPLPYISTITKSKNILK
jgi:hypothetical protein